MQAHLPIQQDEHACSPLCGKYRSCSTEWPFMLQALDVPFSLLADEAAPPKPGPSAAVMKNLTLLNRMQGNPEVSVLFDVGA